MQTLMQCQLQKAGKPTASKDSSLLNRRAWQKMCCRLFVEYLPATIGSCIFLAFIAPPGNNTTTSFEY